MACHESSEASSNTTVKPCILCGYVPVTPIWQQDPYRLVKCTSCELAFIENPPTEEELARLYSFQMGYMEHYADPSTDFSHKWEKARHQCDLLDSKVPKGRLLDVGCSAGFFLKTAKDRGWDVMGIELSPDTAEIGRKRHGLNIVTASLEDSELKEQSFDVITLWDVIEHLPNPLDALHHVKRLLRPGGWVVVESPNIDGLFPRLSYLVANLINFWPHPEPPFHLFQFSKKTMRNVLNRAGFDNITVWDQGIPVWYSFRPISKTFRSPRKLCYFIVFSPIAKLAPLVRAGDAMVVFAQRSGR